MKFLLVFFSAIYAISEKFYAVLNQFIEGAQDVNETVPKIIINNSFRVLFDKIASVYFI